MGKPIVRNPISAAVSRQTRPFKSSPRTGGLKVILVAALAFGVGCPASETSVSDAGAGYGLGLIITGDVMGDLRPVGRRDRLEGGAARMVYEVDRIKARWPGPGLVLDAGNRLARETVVPMRYRSQALADVRLAGRIARRVGLDAMVVGPCDLAFGVGTLRRFARQADTKLLAANLVHVASGTVAFDRLTVVEREGLRVGVVGATWSAETSTLAAAAFRKHGLRSTAVAPAIRMAARAARAAGAQVVVGLLHMPETAAARSLAQLAPGTLDVVVVAHDRLAPEATETRPWFRTGARGRGLLTLSATVTVGADLRWSSRYVRLGPGATADLKVSKWLRAARTSKPKLRTYAGTKRCRACHRPQFKHWKTTAHARAWKTLVKARQTDNWDCIVCHATGVFRPGGPSPGDRLGPWVNVGCESCHAPGLAHVQAPDAPYPKQVSEARCRQCHQQKIHGRAFSMATHGPKILGKGHGPKEDRPSGSR